MKVIWGHQIAYHLPRMPNGNGELTLNLGRLWREEIWEDCEGRKCKISEGGRKERKDIFIHASDGGYSVHESESMAICLLWLFTSLTSQGGFNWLTKEHKLHRTLKQDGNHNPQLSWNHKIEHVQYRKKLLTLCINVRCPAHSDYNANIFALDRTQDVSQNVNIGKALSQSCP
jgi:hypothetical protein